MDSVAIVTIIVIVLSIVLIVTLQILMKYLKKNKNHQKITQLAKEHQCKISSFEFDSSIIIGIDHETDFLFFINTRNNTQDALNLANFKSVKVNHVVRRIGTDKNIQLITDRVELVLSPKNNKNPDFAFELYNSNYAFHLGNELKIAEKWQEIITNLLTN